MNPEDAPPACDTALLAAFSALVSSPTPSVTCFLRRPSRRGASRLSYGKGIPCAGLTLTPGHVVRHAPAARRETPRERERARSGHWTDSKRKIGTPPRSAGCAWCVGAVTPWRPLLRRVRLAAARGVAGGISGTHHSGVSTSPER